MHGQLLFVVHDFTCTAFKHSTIVVRQHGGQIHLNVMIAFDLHKLKMIQEEDLLEQKYFTGSMPLLTPNQHFKICCGPEVFPSTTIFKKHGV